MKLLNAASVIAAGVLLVVVVQLAPATGASTRHHRRRHYRGYRQDPAGAVGSAAAASAAGSPPSTGASPPWPSNCSHCGARQAKRDYRLASIRNEILRKLHLRAPPNVTRGRQLPDIPPLRDLIGDDMVSDAPSNDQRGHDDYHATTVKKMLFPIPGKTTQTTSRKSQIPLH